MKCVICVINQLSTARQLEVSQPIAKMMIVIIIILLFIIIIIVIIIIIIIIIVLTLF